jgi:hypothetical protein
MNKNGRRLVADISYDCNRQDEPFTLRVIKQIVQEEVEICVVYEHPLSLSLTQRKTDREII